MIPFFDKMLRCSIPGFDIDGLDSIPSINVFPDGWDVHYSVFRINDDHVVYCKYNEHPKSIFKLDASQNPITKIQQFDNIGTFEQIKQDSIRLYEFYGDRIPNLSKVPSVFVGETLNDDSILGASSEKIFLVNGWKLVMLDDNHTKIVAMVTVEGNRILRWQPRYTGAIRDIRIPTLEGL